jgi:hypothetical protein
MIRGKEMEVAVISAALASGGTYWLMTNKHEVEANVTNATKAARDRADKAANDARSGAQKAGEDASASERSTMEQLKTAAEDVKKKLSPK